MVRKTFKKERVEELIVTDWMEARRNGSQYERRVGYYYKDMVVRDEKSWRKCERYRLQGFKVFEIIDFEDGVTIIRMMKTVTFAFLVRANQEDMGSLEKFPLFQYIYSDPNNNDLVAEKSGHVQFQEIEEFRPLSDDEPGYKPAFYWEEEPLHDKPFAAQPYDWRYDLYKAGKLQPPTRHFMSELDLDDNVEVSSTRAPCKHSIDINYCAICQRFIERGWAL